MTQHYHKCEEVFYSFCAQVQMFKESHILAFIAVIFPKYIYIMNSHERCVTATNRDSLI